MANYSNINQIIDNNIYANGNEEITGTVLNNVLKEMVSVLGAGYQFMGACGVDTDPGTPDARVFYLATEAGTYSNFGGDTITAPTILYYDTQWHSLSLDGDFTAALRVIDIVNNLNSTSTTKPLSAAMGKTLGDYLNNLNSIISDGYVYMGVATTDTPTPTASRGYKLAYLAVDAATYTNLGSLTVSDNEIAVLERYTDGVDVTRWRKVSLGTYVKTSDIADNLTTNDATKVLSAKQGKLLKDSLDDVKADVDDILDGTQPVALADNITSWSENDDLTVKDTWDEMIRTTAGENPIVTDKGGRIISVVPKTDFYASALKTTGYNQLRLISEGGLAVAVGNGFYFPVPKLTFGIYGTAKENNGILFTNSNGENMTPTVYFKPFGDGVPTTITDGTQLTSKSSIAAANQDGGIWAENGYSFYTTPAAGWLIVSGITRDTTCAHIAWEDWYNKYVAVSVDGDEGGSVDLHNPIHAIHTYDKMLVVGTPANLISDAIDFGSDRATWYRRADKVNVQVYSAASGQKWTDTLNEDGETYTHSTTISAMKSSGLASFMDGTMLTVSGTTVSYVDSNEHAAAADVKYQLATEATGYILYSNTSVFGQDFTGIYRLNDCGVEMLTDATGEAFVTASYAQNYPDALAEIARYNLNEITKVESEAFAVMRAELDGIKALLQNTGIGRLDVKLGNIDITSLMVLGAPDALESSVAGAPSAANVPNNWDNATMGVWTGIGRRVGQLYIIKRSSASNPSVKGAVYMCVGMNNSPSDWLLLAQQS